MSIPRDFLSGIPLRSDDWVRHGRWWTRAREDRTELVPVIAGGTTAAFTQSHARIRNDDGNETTATWKAAEDTNAHVHTDVNFRVRIQVDETAGGTSANFVGVLRYSLNGGAYTVVSASSSVVRSSASPNLADEAATTRQLTAPTGTFLTGAFDEVDGSAGTTQVDFAAGQFTEFEYSVQIRGVDVANGDTIDFRVYRATNVLDVYSVTVRALVDKPLTPAMPVGSLVLAGKLISRGFGVALAAGHIAFAGLAPLPVIGKVPQVPAGHVAYAGTTPTTGIRVAIPAGSIVAAGRKPSVEFLGPDVGSLVFAGLAPTPSVGSATTISPAIGSLLLTGRTPSIGLSVGLPAGHLAYSGTAPSLNGAVGIAIPAGSLVLSGRKPSVAFLGPDVGSVVFAGRILTPSIASGSGTTIAIPAGSVVLTGRTPTPSIAAAGVIAVPAGSLVLAGRKLAVEFSGPDAGALVFAGLAPTPSIGTGSPTIAIPAGSLLLSGKYFGVAFIQPAAGSLVLAGRTPTVIQTGGTTIAIPAGSVLLSGRTPAPAVSGAHVVAIPAGALVLSGRKPAVAFSGPAQGVLVFTGLAPSLAIGTGNPTIAIPAGSLLLAGKYFGVAFIQPPAGSLVLTGRVPTVIHTGGGATTVALSAGSLLLSGRTPSVGFGDHLPIGSLLLSGRTPSSGFGIRLGVGALVLTGRAPLSAPAVSIPAGSLLLVGRTSTIGLGVRLGVGSLALVGRIPDIASGNIAVPVGALVFAGRKPKLVIAALPEAAVIPTVELLPVGASEWVDVTTHVLADPGLKWKRGMFEQGPLVFLAEPGSMTLAFDNHPDDAPLGYYTPGNPNCRPGFKFGAGVRLKLDDGRNTPRYVWRGVLTVIRPEAGIYGSLRTDCVAFDYMQVLAEADASRLELLEDVFTDDAIAAVVATGSRPPALTDYDAGIDLLPFVFDDLGGSQGIKATEVANRVMQSEGGYLYVRGDTTEGETLRMENRLARVVRDADLTIDDTQIADGPDSLEVPSDQSRIVNEAEVETSARRVDAAPTTALVKLDAPIEVGGGTTVRMFIDYRDPTQQAVFVGAKDVQQPQPGTDYTVNDAQDGSGTDLTGDSPGDVSIVATPFGSRVMLEITSAVGGTVFVRGPGTEDGLRVLGRGLYRYAPISSRGVNEDSQTENGVRPLETVISAIYQGDPRIGQDRADLVAFLYGGLVNIPTKVRVRTEDTALIYQGILRDIGDKIILSEEITVPDMQAVFIHGIEQALTVDGVLQTWWTLVPADTSAALVFDDPDFGKFDDRVFAY